MSASSWLSLGLIGYPLGHSLSPRLHTAALQALGLPGEYHLYPLAPGPELQPALNALLERMRRGELHGLNVTIPHKQAVVPLLDECSPAAEAIGAVNTIVARHGRLIGDNTDAPGFLADLRRAFPRLSASGDALMLGAGGAARAVIYALATAGWRVHAAARRPEQAHALVAGLYRAIPPGLPAGAPADASLHALALGASALAGLPTLSLVVNTTSAGMAPDTALDPWPADAPFPTAAVLYDLVYNPPETALMRRAAQAGLAVTNGIGMLVEQAALAFERWTGLEAPRKTMWQAVREFISNSPQRQRD